jgi:hypothetical protein
MERHVGEVGLAKIGKTADSRKQTAERRPPQGDAEATDSDMKAHKQLVDSR